MNPRTRETSHESSRAFRRARVRVREGAVFLALLAIGCQEHAVTKFNNNPEATIRTPVEGDEVAQGEPLLVKGTVDDDDHDYVDLTVTWYVDGDEACTGDPDDDGETECELVVESTAANITLEVRDAMGAVGNASVGVTAILNNKPMILIDSPSAEWPYYHDQKVPFRATVSDIEDIPSALTVTVSSDVDGDLTATLDGNGDVVGNNFLTQGVHLISFTATDTHGGTTVEETVVTVGGANTPPVCAITDPADGTAIDVEETLILQATVDDINIGPQRLGISWISNRDGVIGTSESDATGQTVLPVDVISKATHVITVQVEDEVGARCTDFITLTVGDPPQLVIESPEEGAVYPYGELITFRALVSDAEDRADDVGLEWSTVSDGIISYTGADSTGVAEFALDSLSSGMKAMTVSATDSGGLRTSEFVTFIVNQLPSPPTVQLSTGDDIECVGATTYTDDDLQACIIVPSIDPDGDPITYHYSWYREGVLMAEYSDRVLPAAVTSKGESWQVVVTPRDSLSDGYIGQDTTVIANSVPTLFDVSLSPNPARTDDDVSCVDGASSDADGDPISFDYVWYVNGSTVSESSGVLPSTHHQKGDTVRCDATPTDGVGTGAMVSSDPMPIINSAPTIAGIEITPEVLSTGVPMVCSYYGWSDPDGVSEVDHSRIFWTLNGSPAGEGPTFISGFVGGDLVGCHVVPSDGLADSTQVDLYRTVENSAPTISSVSISPPTPTATDVLTCSWGGFSDIDGHEDSSIVEWTVNGTVVGADPLLEGLFSGGDVIQCQVSAFDGLAVGTVLTSTAMVLNTPPHADGARISPNPAHVIDTLECLATAYVDPDFRDPDVSSVEWSVNGVVVSTEQTLSSGFVGRDTVSCTLTPDDGTATGSPVIATQVITNTLPELAYASITPSPAFADDALTCSWGGWFDADGHPEMVQVGWSINGEDAGSGSTLTGGFSAEDEVTCSATPFDGFDTGEAKSSTVVIGNTLPTIDDVMITPDPAYAEDALTCSWTGFFDWDGDDDASVATWSIDGVFAGTGPLLEGGFGSDDVVTCTVIPSDGRDTGPERTATVVITNTPPSIESVNISPLDPAVGTEVTCAYSGFHDVDEDADFSTFRWLVDGVEVGTGSTLSSGFVGLQTLTCEVTPDDGLGLGEPVEASLVVQNTAPSVATVELSPPSPHTGQDVSCSWTGYEDPDGHSDVSTFEWWINGASHGNDNPLSGDSFTSGDELSCAVTPSDGHDTGDVVYNTVDILNSAPSIMVVTIMPPVIVAGDTLTCSWAGYVDLEGEPDLSTLEWQVNGVTVGTEPTLSEGFVYGDTVVCEVTPFDGIDEGTPVTASKGAGNTAPSVVSASISPDPAHRTHDLTCDWSGYDDPDGNPDESIAKWYVDGDLLYEGAILPGGLVSEGDWVECRVTAFDGVDEGNTVIVDEFVYPTIPSIVSVSINPDPAFVYSTLSCDWVGYTDADNDPDMSTVEWWDDSGAVIGTGKTLSGAFSPLDRVQCEVTPYDGMHQGDPLVATIDITNAVPVVVDVVIGPTPAYTDDNITCAPGTVTDADGSTSFMFRYKWTLNDEELGVTTNSIPSAMIQKHDVLTCSVSADDGLEEGEYTTSDPLTISNSEPVVEIVVLSPDPAKTNETITTTVEASDKDGDEVTFSYRWSVNGGLTWLGDSLDGTVFFDKNDEVVLDVIPDDGEDEGDVYSTPEMIVANTQPDPPVVGVSPTGPVANTDPIVCAIEYPGSDPDGDGLTNVITWKRDGEAYTGPTTTDTLDGDGIAENYLKAYEEWTCEGASDDGEDVGVPATDTVEVQPIFTGWTPADTDLADANHNLYGEAETDYASRNLAWLDDMDGDGRSEVLVGAPENDAGGPGAGKVYLLMSASLGGTVSVRLSDVSHQWIGDIDGGNLGGSSVSRSLSKAGDIDGDGYGDFLMGEPLNDSEVTQHGKAYLFLSSALGPGGTFNVADAADYVFLGENYSNLGSSVAPAGDVNGGGVDDFLIGGPKASTGDGRAYLIFGEELDSTWYIEMSTVGSKHLILDAEDDGDEAGTRASGVGDVNADGYPDVLVGAPNNNIGSATRAGRAYLYFGGTDIGTGVSEIGLESDYFFNGEARNDLAGHSLCQLGDVDRDGYGDFAIASKGADAAGSNSGTVYLIRGGELPAFPTVDLEDVWLAVTGANASDRAGSDIDYAGDVDADGRGDLLIGAFANDAGGSSAGRTYLMLGNDMPDGGGVVPATTVTYTFTGEEFGDSSGYSVSGNGDFNDDGLSDILIGAYLHDGDYDNEGRAYILLSPSIYD